MSADADVPTSPTVPRPYQYSDPDRKSTRLNSSHLVISYAVSCLKKIPSNAICSLSTPAVRPSTPSAVKPGQTGATQSVQTSRKHPHGANPALDRFGPPRSYTGGC